MPAPITRNDCMAKPRRSRIATFSTLLLAPAVWLERAKGRRRLGLVCLYVVIVGISGFFLWWVSSLNGLPDIGAPFDVTKYDSVNVPEDENAFVYYRQMAGRVVPLETQFAPLYKPSQPWSQAAPEIQQWVAANREALALFMKGAERQRGLFLPPRELSFETNIDAVQKVRDMNHVADLEGSRLQESGDLAGAWAVYRAMLWSSRHIAYYGSTVQRILGYAILRKTAPRITSWAKNPQVDAEQIRAALAEVIACEAMTPPASQALEVEYLSMLKELHKPQNWFHSDSGEDEYWYRHMRGGMEAELFLRREPERSRRVAQLVFANWLAYIDRPPKERPKTTTDLAVFEPGPDASASGHVLPAAVLERWNASTLFSKRILTTVPYFFRLLDNERGLFAGLKVDLAEQIYVRERGKPPQRIGDLVGTYLDRLPEGYEDADIPLGDAPPLAGHETQSAKAPGRTEAASEKSKRP